MELDKVKELIDMMKANDLSELEIVDGQTRVVLKRGTGQSVPQVVAQPIAIPTGPASVSPAGESSTVVPGESASQEETVEGKKPAEIISPIVGTYYSSPSPSADSFVELGTDVAEETVVCIIEAMKVMNEIKSGIRGRIKKILVNNGSAVEYGQPLFLVEPE